MLFEDVEFCPSRADASEDELGRIVLADVGLDESRLVFTNGSWLGAPHCTMVEGPALDVSAGLVLNVLDATISI